MHAGRTQRNLLGVDAVREFNVLRDTYGAEYGKHPGGQVTIVTQSGSNQLHGSVYEFLRNNALNARNYFDPGIHPAVSAQPVRRRAGRTHAERQDLLLRQLRRLHRRTCIRRRWRLCPTLASRAKAAPSVQPLLNLWPTPTASDPNFNGIAACLQQPAANHSRELRHRACGPHLLAERHLLGGLHHRRRPRFHADDRSILTAPTS